MRTFGYVHDRGDVVLFSPAVVGFSSITYNATEGSGNATITVNKTGNAAAMVSYQTVGGTATLGSDYTGVAGTLTWAYGDTAAKTFAVPILNDAAIEDSETVLLALSGAVGATISRSEAVLIIASEDVTPPMVCPIPQVNMRFVVSTDFYPIVNALLDWSAGASQFLTVVRAQGSLPDTIYINHLNMPANGTVTVRVYHPLVGSEVMSDIPNAGSATLIANIGAADTTVRVVVFTVVAGVLSWAVTTEDGPGVLNFSTASYSGSETAPPTVSVSRAAGANGAVSVRWAPARASVSAATPGIDYSRTSGTLSWANGDTTPKTFVAPVLVDGVSEFSSENFVVGLFDVTGGAVVGLVNLATIQISNNST